MVIPFSSEPKGRRRAGPRRGYLEVDLVVALAILMLAVLPVGYSVLQERKLTRAYYSRAVAMAIVDGEFEVLRAGAWRRFEEGSHSYQPHAESASQLPSGRFTLTVTGEQLRLVWQPEGRGSGSAVVREGRGKP